MARESVTQQGEDDRDASGNEGWSYAGTVMNEDPESMVDRKLYQAAGLSVVLYGNQPFHAYNATIQGNVLGLLHDTICEALAGIEHGAMLQPASDSLEAVG